MMPAASNATPRSAPRDPLVVGDPSATLAFDGKRTITRGAFLAEATRLAARLPDSPHAINLCEDRYRFLLAFGAAALRGQTTLLPPARTEAAIDEIRRRHPGHHLLHDAAVEALCAADAGQAPAVPRIAPGIAGTQRVAVGFTSGSTGQPGANPKTWAGFRASTAQNLAALADLLDGPATPLVATVPSQHMYGMEMSVLLPLLAPVALHTARPFFPGDVAGALADAPSPPLLVTTPVHLRALVESGLRLPRLAGIVSATAPLPVALAERAEQRFGAEVRELFGSTETCVIARRRTAREAAWQPLPGVRLQPRPDGTAVTAPHLAAPVVLADLVALHPEGGFVLHGRNSDLLEIAGKRASLGDLTRKLLDVEGVRDGVVFQLDEADAAGVRRIAALVVAPGRQPAELIRALRAAVDPVFLPRPLFCVDALPRNETGKLPREALLAMVKGASQT